MADQTPDFIKRLKEDTIVGIAACLQDLDVYLDLAESYDFLPQENIDIGRKKLKNLFQEEK